MASKGFNLTAQINLRGPSNIRQVVGNIRKQLNGLTANIDVKLNAKTARQITVVNKSFQTFNRTLQQTSSISRSTAKALDQLSSSASGLSGNLKSVPQNVQNANQAAQKMAQSNTKAAKATKELTTEFESFGKQSALAIRRYAAFAGVTATIYKLSNAINAASKDFVDFEQELIKVSQVTDTSISSLDFLVDKISDLSTKLGVSSRELISVSRTLSQAGLSATETSKALEALARSALAPTFDSLNDTVEGSIALMKQFSIGANQLEIALGSINAVAGKFAVEAGDIITAISRTGGVFASASKGVSQGTDALNEFISVFTSVRATTRESAETIATGLRTIFTRIQREDTIDALKEYGVTLTDLEGKFVGPFEATKRLAEGLSSLDPRDIKFSRIVEELGGFRQIGKVIPLIQQFSTAQQALNVAQTGGASLARDAATAQLSLANQLSKVQEQFSALVRDIGQSEGFRSLAKVALNLTSGMIALADAAKSALPAITAIFAIKGFSALTQFTRGFAGSIRRSNNQSLNTGGYVHNFSAGGVVPGSGSRDTVPAMLTPGEFVIRKQAVSAIGAGNLKRINKFAGGGGAKASMVQDVEYVDTYDGDSLRVNYTPEAKPYRTSTRLVGYDAYELTSGSPEERKKGLQAKNITEAWAKGQSKQALLDKFTSASGKKDKYGRPMFDAPRLGQRLVKAGVAIAYSGSGEKATKDKKQQLFSGGFVQKFADGGTVQRRVGYIDYDVIANPANKDIVTKGMNSLGVKGPRLYTDALAQAAVSARKNQSLEKLISIYGVAGSGKTTLARGQGTDDARLRKTQRFPILTPEDIQKATEVIVLSSSVSKKKLDEVFENTDRTYTLSSTTPQEKARISSQRQTRDTTGVGLEGRKPGTTTNVESDTALGEALLADRLGRKSAVLTRTESGRLRSKRPEELVNVIKKKIGFTWGGFSPMTAGHESIMDAAKAVGIPYEDFIYLVGSNEAIKNSDPSSYRTAIFDQDARVLLAKAGAGSRGAMVLPKDKGFEVPQAFDIGENGGRRQVVVPAQGSVTFAADKSESSLSKYKEAGYDVKNLERTGGISGTQVRDLIMSGNMGQLQEVLSPNVYELISNNIKRIQNRANALPSIIADVKQREDVSLAGIEQQIKSLGISRIDNKRVESDPEYAAQVEVLKELRKKRDKIKSFASFEPYSILAKMAAAEPDQYGLDLSMSTSDLKPMRTMGKGNIQKANLGGFIHKFMSGGIVQKFIDGGWVERMKTQPDSVLKSALQSLDMSGLMLEFERKVAVGTFDPSQPFEEIGKRELNQRIKAIQDVLAERKIKDKEKFANRRGPGLQPTENYDTQEMLDAITYYQAGSGPFIKALASGKKTFKDPRGDTYETQDINDRLLAASQFKIPSKTYSGLGRSQLKEILKDTGVSPKKLASKPRDILPTLVGKTVNFPTFLSVSSDKEQAEAFVQDPGALLRIDGRSTSQKTIDVIKARKKTKTSTANIGSRRLSGLEKISDKKLDLYDEEKEFIIPPNVSFKITKATGKVSSDFVADLKSKPAGENLLEAYFDEDDDYFERTRLNLSAQMLRSGGKVQKFASGGIVPGTGNRDTVPAMLTPGEFVIRKKAVETIGVDKLASMNKYADGGLIQKFAAGGLVEEDGVGAIVLTPKRGGGGTYGYTSSKTTVGINKGLIEKKLGQGLSIDPDAPGAESSSSWSQIANADKIYNVEMATTSQATARTFRAIVKAQLLKSAKESASRLSQRIRGVDAPADLPLSASKQFVDSMNDASVGNLFENTLSSLKGPPFSTDSKASFDFPNDQIRQNQNLTSLFPGITASFVDAKASGDEVTVDAMRTKILNRLAAEARSDRVAVSSQGIEGPARSLTSPRIAEEYTNEEIMAMGFKPGSFGESGFKKTRRKNQQNQSLYEYLGDPQSRNLGGAIQRFVNGGAVEQQVPASDKPKKAFGIIGFRSNGSEIMASYIGNKTRTGSVSAKSAGNSLYTVGLSKATKGYGPKLYDVVMEIATSHGSALTSDRNVVSADAQRVWEYYFNNRTDVNKIPLDPSQWTKNQSLIDPKLYGRPETWPSPTDPAWILQSGYTKQPNLIHDENSAINLNDPKYEGYVKQLQLSYLSRNRGGGIPKFAKGGSAEDKVPALLTPGEFVINKKAAARIGSQKLHQLNQADKIRGYNKGGFVHFREGGRAPARPGTELSTIGISQADVNELKAIANAIQELGIKSSDSSKLIKKGFQATYESAINAAEADLLRAKAVGADTSAIETNIQALRNQGSQSQKVSKALSNTTGSQLQGLQSRLERGQDIGKAAKKEGIGGLASLAASGQADIDSIKAYIAQASRDRETLNSMDQRYIKERSAQLQAQGKSTNEIKKITQEEVSMRRKAIDDVAMSQGAQGPESNRRESRAISEKLAFIVPTITSLLGSIGGEPTTASGAAFSAGVQGAGIGFGVGQAVSSVAENLNLPGKLGELAGPIGMAASAAIGLGQALISATNASRQFRIDEQFKKSEKAMEDVGRTFEKLEKDIGNLNLRRQLESKIIQAGDALAKGLEIQNQTAKVFWANALDVLVSKDQGAAAERSQILEREGILSYLSSFNSNFRQQQIGIQRLNNSGDLAKQFQPIADSINKSIDQQAGIGRSAEDIIGGPNFDRLARSLAMSDEAINRQIATIQNSTNITQAEKDARIKSITTIYAEEAVRKRVAIIERQKELEALQKATSVYARSLERMFQNMEQSIGAAAAQLEKMNSQIDITVASLQGQARIGDVLLDAITILQNPRAFTSGQVTAATGQAANIFGSQSTDMSALINLGESIETSVMSAVNRTLAAEPGATEPRITSEIGKAVDQTLADLGLPPELADKMANEVSKTLADLQKSGDDKIDYASLAEKLGSLNSVIESSKRAREIALKALEHYNKALNSYTANLNKIIDIEISSRNYARKAVDLLADSELELAKALRKTVKVVDIINSREAQIRRQTGGATTPQDIFDNILKLERERQAQQATVSATAQQGLGATDQFIKLNNNLKDTSVQLRENIAALKDLANNGDVAAAALQKIQEAQQRNAQQVGFLEKVVTSTPEELEGMNRAFYRLQNNINGQVNTIDQSVGAQKAYYEALRSGASQFDAMRAAQGAFAKERGETLGLLQDILPFLGQGQETGAIRANVLESMLRESGVGVNPIFQQVLNTLRNPQVDPAVQAAIQQYQQANALQSKANELLGRLDARLAEDIAKKNEISFKNALDNVTFNFENAQLNDIANGVNTIVNILQQPNQGGAGQAQAIARGGIVYAQAGQQIFQPKGTDTVPAMLTPGEFVVNKKATQANLPLLKGINNGYYAAGGLVTSWNGYQDVSARSAVTKDEFPIISSILNSEYKGPISNIPPIAYDTPSSKGAQSPARGRLDPNKISLPYLTELSAGGDPQYGVYPSLKTRGGYLNYIPNGNLIESFRNEASEKINGPDNAILYKQIKTAKISRDQLEEYREALQTKGIIAAIDNDRIADLSVGDYGKLTKFNAKRTANLYTPTRISTKPFGLILGPPPLLEARSPLDQIVEDSYKGFSSDDMFTFLGGNLKSGAYAVSTGREPDYSGTPLGDLKYSPIRGFGAISRHYMLDKNAGTDRLLQEQALIKFIDNHKLNKDIVYSVQNLLGKDPVFDKGKTNPIHEKLSLLYNNQSPYEEFTDANLNALINKDAFIPTDYDGDKSIKNLIVVGKGGLEAALIAKAKEAIQLRADNQVPKGIFGAKGLANSASTIGMPFDIATDIGVDTKDFAWAANINYTELGKAFEEAKKEDLRKRAFTDGVNTKKLLGMETIKKDLNVGLPKALSFDFNVQYEKYNGKLFDTALNDYSDEDIEAFLPFKVDGDPFHLFKNVINDGAKRIGLEGKLKANDITFSTDNVTLKDYYNSLIAGEGDPNLENDILGTTVSLKPLLLRLMRANGPMPVFTKKLVDSQNVNIGEAIVANMKKQAESEAGRAGAIDDPGGLKGEQLDESLLATVTKKLTLGGLQLFARRQFVRGLSGFLGGQIGRIPRNDNIDTPEEAMNVAGFVSGVFSQIGGMASRSFDMARNGRAAQFIKEAFILADGARQAFAGIAGGETALIRDFFVAGDNDLPLGYVEGLFRSLGGGAALGAVKGYKLPGAYKNMFDDMLKGGKIARIGTDGSLSYESMTDAVPTDVQGLIDLIFNPYNEFTQTKARSTIIERFQQDLNNLKGGRGLPFFDPTTYDFINRGVDILQQWYGGTGNAPVVGAVNQNIGPANQGGQVAQVDGWPGQDYLSDQRIGQTSQQRAQTLVQAIQNPEAQKLYRAANEVNASFGIKNKFGPLPGEEWFRSRGIRGDDPQALATGGVVYAQSGGQMVHFKPQGTDTVPAMLTPGEFVINRKATQENLPLLQAINDGAKAYSKGGVVYAEDGGKVDVTNKANLNSQMLLLVNSLSKYTSGKQGRDKLSALANRNMDIDSFSVGSTGQEIKASYYTSDNSKHTNKSGRVVFSEQLTGAPTVRHEMAHAIANSKHNSLLKPFINSILIQELKNSNYKDLGDTGYEIEDLIKYPAEMFAVLASITSGLGSASEKFLKQSMKALGYNNGGIVYAAGGRLVGQAADMIGLGGLSAIVGQTGATYSNVQKALDTVATVGDVGRSAYGASSAGASLGSTLTAGAATYGGSVIATSGLQAARYAWDPEAETQRIYELNRQQAGQGYAQNVAENLINPGQAGAQLIQESAGTVDDISKAMSAAEKTQRMIRDKRERRAAKRVRDRLMKGSILDAQNFVTGGKTKAPILTPQNRISFMQRDMGDPRYWSPYGWREREEREKEGKPSWYFDPNFETNGVGAESRGNYLPYSTEMKRPAYREFTDDTGDYKVKAYVLSVSDKEVVLQKNNGRTATVPLNRLSASDRSYVLNSQSWSDHMGNEGDLGFSGRPTGQMLKVPDFLRDMATSRFTDNTGTVTRAARILEVGPDGAIMEALSGPHTGRSGMVPYSKLDSKGRRLAYELYESAKRTQQRQAASEAYRLEERVAKLLPGGYTREILAAVNSNMSDNEIRQVARKVETDRVAEAKRQQEERKAQREAQIDQERQTRVTDRLNDPSQTRRVATDAKQVAFYRRQFAGTGLPDDQYPNWLRKTYPSMSRDRYDMALSALDQVADVSEAPAPSTPGKKLGETGEAFYAAQEDRRQSKRQEILDKAQERYDALVEKYGKDKAKESMRKRGYSVDDQGAVTKSKGVAGPPQKSATDDFLIDRYWKQYNASGTKLDPLTWAKRNLPGLKGARLEAFVGKSGLTMEEAEKKTVGVTQYKTIGLPARGGRAAIPSETREEVTQTTGLGGEEPGSYYAMDKERFLAKIMKEEGVTRWQAGNLYDQRQAKAVGEWKQKLAEQMAIFKTALDEEIKTRMPDIRSAAGKLTGYGVEWDSVSPIGISYINTLKEDIHASLIEKGILADPRSIDPRITDGIDLGSSPLGSGGATALRMGHVVDLEYLPRNIFTRLMQQSTVGAITEQALQKAWNSQVGAGSIEAAGALPGRLDATYTELMAAFDRATQTPAENKSRGGMIYANQGMLVPYRPKGTDTVPAMLTPGEFVVNRAATQKNLPLLKAINNGSKGYSQGGVVYLADGTDDRQEDRNKKILRLMKGSFGARAIHEMINAPDNFVVFNDEAFSTMGSDGIVRSITEQTESLKTQQEQRDYLATQARKFTARSQYLRTIIANSSRLLKYNPPGLQKTLQEIDPLVNFDGSDSTIETILEDQVYWARNELSDLAESSKILFQKYVLGRSSGSLEAPPKILANGGVVYADKGMLVNYQPKGTDTVPAMLTPGEFVVNREASSKHYDLLTAINSSTLSGGGRVNYLENGTAGGISFSQIFTTFSDGVKTSLQTINAAVSDLIGGIQNVSGGVNNTGGNGKTNFEAIGQFTATFQRFIDQLEKISLPPEITVTVTQQEPIRVDIIGAEALQNLLDGPFGNMIADNVKAALNNNNILNENPPLA